MYQCFEFEFLAVLSPETLLSACWIGKTWAAICCLPSPLLDTCNILISTLVTSHKKYFLRDPMFHFLLFSSKGLSLKTMQFFFWRQNAWNLFLVPLCGFVVLTMSFFPTWLDDQFEEG